MSVDNRIDQVKNIIRNMKNCDNEKLADEIYKWIYEISYFYNTIVKPGQNPSDIPYKIKPSKRPSEGQIAYFNLRRGYPKETFDDHWCYILKDYNTKYLIVPTTSIKPDSAPCDLRYELDIDDFTPTGKSRLQITDMRSVDVMRVCQSMDPNFYDVKTPRNDIIEKIRTVIFS